MGATAPLTQEARWRALFEAIDQNGDGEVTRAELIRTIRNASKNNLALLQALQVCNGYGNPTPSSRTPAIKLTKPYISIPRHRRGLNTQTPNPKRSRTSLACPPTCGRRMALGTSSSECSR